MAALQSIRNHPALLMTVLGGGLILMIIMFGFDDYNGFFQSGRDTVLDVNGKTVSWAQYETERQRTSDFLQAYSQRDVNDSETSHQINDQVYNQFVQDMVLSEQLEKVGLTVCDEEIDDLVHGDHISPVMTQIFGEQAKVYGDYFAQLVQNDGFDEVSAQNPFFSLNNWLFIENQVASTRKAQKYNALVQAAVAPNTLEAKDAFNGDNQEVAFSYVRKPVYSVADSLVTVSNNELKAWYESHKDRFKMQAKARQISYIAVPLLPSADDQNAVLENLQKVAGEFAGDGVEELISANSAVPFINAYLNDNTFRGELKEFIDQNPAGTISEPKIYRGDILNILGEQSKNNEQLSEYYYMVRILGKQNAPDSVKLVISAATAETQDSIFTEVKKGSQDDNAVWATNLTLMQFEEGLRAKIENAKKNDVFKYDFENGQQHNYLVAKVVEKTAPVAQSKVAVYAEKISPSSKTRRTEYGKLNEFVNTHTTIQEMEDSAMVNGFRMMDAMVYSTSYNINQVRDCRQAVRFAFEGEKNAISEIYEDGGYLMVVGIKGDIEENYSTLESPSTLAVVNNAVKNEKKAAYLLANDFANVADKSLEGYAAALGVEIQEASRVNFNLNSVSGLGAEPAVIAEALKAQEGTVVGPIAGTNNVVVLKVTSKNNKDLTYDEEASKAKVSANAYRNAAGVAMQYISRSAEITDNRLRFY
ncbi:MAG: SurA N-terminal domain-containing protein [Bacteroidales bacterium]|nr:SurA N-terminal domain-containing protein [Candidatus Liminaster caballi]